MKKSTKTADKTLAMDIAVKWDRTAKAARGGRLVESQMRRILSEITEQATGEALHFHTIRAWFDEWLAGKAGAVSERTLTKYRQTCNSFLDHIGNRAEVTLPAISVADVRSFRDGLCKKGLSASTANQAIKKASPHLSKRPSG